MSHTAVPPVEAVSARRDPRTSRIDPRTVGIDPRGARFAAALTAAVLAVGLVTANVWVLAAQSVVFALGAALGAGRTPYGWAFRRFVRPRIGAPAELEAAAPPRFAQAVGLVFALVATAGFALGVTAVGVVATALAFAAAFLNAAFGFCLGCELYLVGRRLTSRPTVQNAGNQNTGNQSTSAAAVAASKEVNAA